MFSILRPTLVYRDISADVVEHDEDHDAEEWSYPDKTVYKGSLDTTYNKYGLDVYWLYDDSLKRIGLAEHDAECNSEFRTLWFRDNVYSTLLHEDGWKCTNATLFSNLTAEAYQDMIDKDKSNILLKCHGMVVIPEYVISGIPDAYQCETCGTRSFSLDEKCISMKKIKISDNPIFIDDSYVIYTPPSESNVWSSLGLRTASCEQTSQEPLQLPPVQTAEEPQT